MKLPISRSWPILQVSILALAYFLTGKLAASMLGLVKAEASPVWPPAGVALAALVLKGRWIWPGLVLGSLLLNCSNSLNIPLPVITTSALSVTLQALIGEAFLERIRFSPRLEQLRDVFGLVTGAAFLSTLLGSTFSNLSACLFGWTEWSSFWRNWWTLWLGDSMGILVVTPALFMWNSCSSFGGLSEFLNRKHQKVNVLNSPYSIPPKATEEPLTTLHQKFFRSLLKHLQRSPVLTFSPRAGNPPASMEGIVWFSLLLAVSWLVFGSKTEAARALYPLEYLPFPFVVWGALRFGQQGAVWASLLVSGAAIVGAVQGGGPFLAKSENLNQAVLFLQAFMGVVAITALVLAAAVSERQQALIEIRRVAALLQEREASLANAQRIAKLGNWDLNYVRDEIDDALCKTGRQPSPLGRELRWSAELYCLLGFAPHSFEPTREAFLAAVHPDDRELVQRSLQQAINEQKPYCIDYRIILPNGEERVVCEQSAIKPTGITATVQDVTERKQAELALRVSAERERLLSEMALRIRQSLDLDQILNTTVAEVRQLLKADRAFIATWDGADLVSPNNLRGKVVAESVVSPYRPILGWTVTNEAHLEELRVFYTHNRLRVLCDTTTVESSSSVTSYYKDYQIRATLNVPIFLGDQLYGVLAVNQCASSRVWQPFEINLLEQLGTQVAIALQQVQLLQQVKALNTNLERQVEERTHQLQQKMHELEESNRLKDLFLYAVSHNLRTPIMGMIILLKNLLNKPAGDVRSYPPDKIVVSRSILERMIQGSEQQLNRVNSLLEAHASEENGLALHCIPLQLNQLYTEIVNELEPLLEKNRANLTVQIPAELPALKADPQQLRRVLENLLNNALKHNPPGVNLILKAEVISDFSTSKPNSRSNFSTFKKATLTPLGSSHQSFIRCTVEDNGVGISPQQCESLFQLCRCDVQSRQTGLRLGLYLSRQIVVAHGGEIGVESTVGKGSAFWFVLPIINPSLCDEYEQSGEC